MAHNKITIIVNGRPEEVPAGATIASLISLFREFDEDLLVEKNGLLVFPESFDRTPVATGDVIEFINPSFGG